MRILLLVLLAIVPWYFGTVDWTTQYYYLILASLICGLGVIINLSILFHRSRGSIDLETSSQSQSSNSSRKSSESSERAKRHAARKLDQRRVQKYAHLDKYLPSVSRLLPPLPAILFLVVAAWATLQTVPLYSLQNSTAGPNVVQMQRLFLGENAPQVAARLNISQVDLEQNTGVEANTNALLSSVESRAADKKLSWSIEPLHTQAAAGMMGLIAALVWLGRCYFSDRVGQMWLFSAISIVGVLVALVGVAGLLAYDKTNFLGLSKGYSFGPFVSRNSGGCFLNLCLSASMGMTTLAFTQASQRHTDTRYRSTDNDSLSSIFARIEAAIGQLTTLQIGCIIVNAILFAAVISTASRGASISAVAAVFMVLAFSGGRSGGTAKFLIAIIIAAIGTTFLFYFELDDRLRKRFDQSIWEDNFESGRKFIWGVSYYASLFYSSTGSGLGTFHFAHLPFLNGPANTWYYHAESIYWQALVELGWIALVIFAGLGLVFFRVLFPHRKSRTSGGTSSFGIGGETQVANSNSSSGSSSPNAAATVGLALLITQGLHSFFDFSLVLPSCFVTAALLLGAIYGESLNAVKVKVQKFSSSSSRSRRSRTSRRSKDVAVSLPPRRVRLTDISRGIQPNLPSGQSEQNEKNAALQTTDQQTAETTDPAQASALKRESEIRSDADGEATETKNSAWTWAFVCTLLAGGLIGWLQYQSIEALDLLGRGDRMRFWVSRQNDLPTVQRASSPSVLLAGIWGEPVESLDDCPDALRHIGLALLQEYQWQRADDLIEELKLPRNQAIRYAAPAVTNVALASLAEDAKSVSEFFVSPLQQQRWQRADSFLQRAALDSPLDWRTQFGIYLLSYDLPAADQANLAKRLERIASHRPEQLIPVAVIEQARGRQDEALQMCRVILNGSLGLDTKVANLLMQWYPDGEIPLDIFQDEAGHLLRVAGKIKKADYPVTHEALIDRAEQIANSMPGADNKRFLYLAQIDRDRGDSEALIEHLAEAVRRDSSQWSLRVELANTAINIGDLQTAQEQLDLIQFESRREPSVAALEKRLESERYKITP